MYMHIFKDVYKFHADGGVMWMPYWDKPMCMCDIPLTWLICVGDIMRVLRDMVYLCVAHDSSVCMVSLIHMINVTWHTRDLTDWYVTWLVHVWNESFIRMTWLIFVCDMMRHMRSACETCWIHTWNMSLSYVWHHSFIYVIWHMCDMARAPDE